VEGILVQGFRGNNPDAPATANILQSLLWHQ